MQVRYLYQFVLRVGAMGEMTTESCSSSKDHNHIFTLLYHMIAPCSKMRFMIYTNNMNLYQSMHTVLHECMVSVVFRSGSLSITFGANSTWMCQHSLQP